MGLTNIYAKYLVVALLLWVSVANAQVNTTTIPGKLKIKTVPNTVAAGDSALTTDPSGNVKKAVFRPLATGINGLNGTTTIGLGGSLTQNTAITGGAFNLTYNGNNGLFINNTAGAGNIVSLQNTGTTIAEIFPDGVYYGPGFGAFTGRNDAFIATGTSGIAISRNQADNKAVLTIRDLNPSSTGNVISFQSSLRPVFEAGNNGLIGATSFVTASGGRATGFSITGSLKPTANNDVLTGLRVSTIAGTSTIASIGSLTAGSGYPNGTQNCNVTGGTGIFAVFTLTISGGGVTSATLLDGGVNYTNGDVLTLTVLDSSGIPVGSGATVTVSGITSYTGITGYSIQTDGLDQYTSDLSSIANIRTKMDKGYVDTHSAGVSLASTTTAPIPFPKMTTTQKNAISPVTEGMVVYDTTLHKISYYDGTIWQSP